MVNGISSRKAKALGLLELLPLVVAAGCRNLLIVKERQRLYNQAWVRKLSDRQETY
jgi:hypothetical protein